MTEYRTAHEAYVLVDSAFKRMREETPELSNIYDAFRELMAEQAALKAELPLLETLDLEIDPVKHSQGVPLLGSSVFAAPWEMFRKGALRILPAMGKGFPKIREQLDRLARAIEKAEAASDPLAQAIITGEDQALCSIAKELGCDPNILEYAITQMKKPFAEKRAESLPPLPEEVKWLKGYCPICGSWPELSFLEGAEGRRWLRCSFCAHEWQYPRTQCPFCGEADPAKIELIFHEDRKFERAELCHQCKKYAVSLDLRERIQDTPRAVAAIRLVYLDIIAQGKGFSPGAICGWNVLE